MDKSISQPNCSARNNPMHRKLQVDRLSLLPDDVLLHIFSFAEAVVAIRASVLSKRFAYLWINLHCLNFNDCKTDFINKALVLHKKSHIEKFSLKHEFPFRRVEDVDRWIEVISLAKAKEVTLNIVDDWSANYLLRGRVFDNQSLRKLSLACCDIDPVKLNVNLPSLRSLHLNDSTLFDECLSKILDGCPSLEELELHNCVGERKVSITNKCLKRLDITNWMVKKYRQYDGVVEISITAPKLESLAIWEMTYVRRVRILNACKYFEF